MTEVPVKAKSSTIIGASGVLCSVIPANFEELTIRSYLHKIWPIRGASVNRDTLVACGTVLVLASILHVLHMGCWAQIGQSVIFCVAIAMIYVTLIAIGQFKDKSTQWNVACFEFRHGVILPRVFAPSSLPVDSGCSLELGLVYNGHPSFCETDEATRLTVPIENLVGNCGVANVHSTLTTKRRAPVFLFSTNRTTVAPVCSLAIRPFDWWYAYRLLPTFMAPSRRLGLDVAATTNVVSAGNWSAKRVSALWAVNRVAFRDIIALRSSSMILSHVGHSLRQEMARLGRTSSIISQEAA